MRLEIGDNYKKTLILSKDDKAICCRCGNESRHLFYCEIEKRLFCYTCNRRQRACSTLREHTDFKIDEIEREE